MHLRNLLLFNMVINVVYLLRFNKDCIVHFERFINSYKKFRAGIHHNLHFIIKGWENTDDAVLLIKNAYSKNFKFFVFPDDGYDWGAYMRYCLIENLITTCFLTVTVSY